MSDLKRDLRRYIDGLEEPVSVQETMQRSTSGQRFRIPAAVLAGAAVVLIPALVLVGLRLLPGDDGDVVATTTAPVTVTTTTSDAPTTSSPPTSAPPVGAVQVPNLDGMTEAEARAILAEIGLELEVTEEYPSRSGFGLITAQGPLAGETAETGSTVVVGVRVEAECLSYSTVPFDVAPGNVAVTTLFGCAQDDILPDVSFPIVREVPEAPTRIEATLRALLIGLTDEQRAMGFSSFFSAETADALNSVVVDGSRITVDFNEAIQVGNASTTTGSLFLMAELQANLFQFPEVNTIEFRLNGNCDAFFGWLQGECQISTRSEWQASLAAWDAERALQPEPGDQIRTENVVGRTFATQTGESNQEILRLDGGTQTYSGFNEIGGWLLDDPASDPAGWTSWALHVAGQDEEMIWFVDSSQRGDNGRLVFEVRSILVIPWDEIEFTADPFVVTGADACTRNGQPEPTILVVAEIAENADGSIAEFMRTLRAWRIDIEAGSFTEIGIDGIECLFQPA